MYCKQCGRELAQGASFCKGCGSRMAKSPAQDGPPPPGGHTRSGWGETPYAADATALSRQDAMIICVLLALSVLLILIFVLAL